MKQLLKDITTTKDGESFDVVRVAMVLIVGMLPFIMIWGIVMQTLAFILSTKDYARVFDMSGSFTAVLAFLAGASAFLMSGAASLYFKRSTEPNGTVTETESITKGTQPDTNINTTVVKL